jgi:hypothetical protein
VTRPEQAFSADGLEDENQREAHIFDVAGLTRYALRVGLIDPEC